MRLMTMTGNTHLKKGAGNEEYTFFKFYLSIVGRKYGCLTLMKEKIPLI